MDVIYLVTPKNICEYVTVSKLKINVTPNIHSMLKLYYLIRIPRENLPLLV